MARFDFVGDDPVAQAQQFVSEDDAGSRVEHGERPALFRLTQGRFNGIKRNLQLHNDGLGTKKIVRVRQDFRRAERVIRPGDKHDLILPDGIDRDHRDARRGVRPARHGSHIDSIRAQAREQFVTKRIVAHRTDQRALDAHARHGAGLICALATGRAAEVPATHGLAGLRQARRIHHQIHVQTAHDGDHAGDYPDNEWNREPEIAHAGTKPRPVPTREVE